jgi:hypothetical protein
LQPGNYEVKVAATNFKQSILESVQVQVGQIAAADLNLEVGGRVGKRHRHTRQRSAGRTERQYRFRCCEHPSDRESAA